MEKTMVYFLIYLIEAIIFWQYCSSLFYSRKSKLAEGLFLLILYSLLFFISFFEYPWLNTTAFFFANFLYIALCCQIKWFSALFHSALVTILMGLSELIIIGIMSYFIPEFLADSMHIRNLVILAVFGKIIYFLLLTLLVRFSTGKKEENSLTGKSIFFLTAPPVVTIYVMLTLLTVCSSLESSPLLDWLISSSAFLLLIINLLNFGLYNYTQKRNLEFTNMQLSYQKEADSLNYYKMLNQQNEAQSLLIHDIKKHLHSIALLNEQGESQKITDYINRIVSSSELQSSAHICNNKILNAILCRYTQQCKQLKISFRADIRNGIIDFLKEDELTALFCNLMDNAVEAARIQPDSFIELHVDKRNNTAFTIITMTNSCLKNPFCMESRKLISHKPDKLRHGFGLKSVQRIVDLYGGNMQTYYSDETHTFHTILTLKH